MKGIVFHFHSLGARERGFKKGACRVRYISFQALERGFSISQEAFCGPQTFFQLPKKVFQTARGCFCVVQKGFCAPQNVFQMPQKGLCWVRKVFCGVATPFQPTLHAHESRHF